jgi:endo-1,4-beta-mannosidase
MDSERYLERRSLNESPYFESNNFIEWKNRFESYVNSIDHDLWHVISIGDFQPMKTNFESQNEFFNRKFCKNIEVKIIIYKTLHKS